MADVADLLGPAKEVRLMLLDNLQELRALARLMPRDERLPSGMTSRDLSIAITHVEDAILRLTYGTP